MTGNKWHRLLPFSLQDEPLSLDYSRISLTHCPLSLKMHCSSSFCIQYWNTSWVLDQRTHEDKDYVIYRALKSLLTASTSVKKKLKRNLICCSSQLQPLQIRPKYLLAHSSQQGIPPAKYIILPFKTTHKGGTYWIILGAGTGDLHLAGFITLNNSTTDL